FAGVWNVCQMWLSAVPDDTIFSDFDPVSKNDVSFVSVAEPWTFQPVVAPDSKSGLFKKFVIVPSMKRRFRYQSTPAPVTCTSPRLPAPCIPIIGPQVIRLLLRKICASVTCAPSFVSTPKVDDAYAPFGKWNV